MVFRCCCIFRVALLFLSDRYLPVLLPSRALASIGDVGLIPSRVWLGGSVRLFAADKVKMLRAALLRLMSSLRGLRLLDLAMLPIPFNGAPD